MNHPNVVDTHRRYKHGTTKLVTWLVSSVQRIRTSNKKSNNSNDKFTDSKVAVDDLMRLAERIIRSNKPRIDIPEEILDVLYDVISGRTASHQFYTSILGKEQNDSLKASNEGHHHVIQVLKQVQELLRTTFKARLPGKSRDAFVVETGGVPQNTTNVFASLRIQDADDDMPAQEEKDEDGEARKNAFLAEHGIPKKGKKTKAKAKKMESATKQPKEQQEYELAETEGADELLAIWSLLSDLHEIRLHVSGLWQQYVAGGMHFLTVSRLTDMATAITQDRCAKMVTVMPKFAYWWDLIRTIGIEKAFDDFKRNNHFVGVPTGRNVAEALLNQSVGNAELFCLDGCHAMVLFQRELRKRLGQSMYAHCNCTQCRPKGFAKAVIDSIPFLSELANMRDSNGKRSEITTLDNFTNSLTNAVVGGRLTLDLVACAEIYTEIYRLLGDNFDVGYKDSLAALDAVQSQFTTFEKALRSGSTAMKRHLDPVYWLNEATMAINTIKPVSTTQGREGWQVVADRPGSDRTKLVVPVDVMRNLLMVPSCLAKRFMVTKTSMDTVVGSTHGLVFASAYLYRAARASGNLRSCWLDMDFVIDRQNTRDKFCRPVTNRVKSVYTAFGVGRGFSAAKYAKNPREDKNKLLRPTKDHIEMNFASAYLDALRECCRLDKILGAPKPADLRLLWSCVNIHSKTGLGIRDPEIAAQYKDTKVLTPCQLLTVLQEVVTDDEMQHMFDYTGFVVQCLNMLESIAEKCKERLARFQADLGTATGWFEQMVSDIILESAAAEEQGRVLKGSMLSESCEIMGEMIEVSGSKFVEKAKDLCSGGKASTHLGRSQDGEEDEWETEEED